MDSTLAAPSSEAVVVRPSEWWADHFRQNRQHDWQIAWHIKHSLTSSQLAEIGASIADFQRGESSEARTYLSKSRLFSDRAGDAAFHATSVLFIREENGHADLLLRFMRLVGIPSRRRSAGDRIFRGLRSLGDLGWSSRVLIVAELIAQEYYPCLREATSHPVLRGICDKLIYDEEAHIRFQVERIVRVEASLGSLNLALRDLFQIALTLGATLIVFATHHAVVTKRLKLTEFVSRMLIRNRAAILAMRILRGRSKAAPFPDNGPSACDHGHGTDFDEICSVPTESTHDFLRI